MLGDPAQHGVPVGLEAARRREADGEPACTQPSLSGGHLGLLPQQQGLETWAGMGKGVCHLWWFVQTPQSTSARGTGCSLDCGGLEVRSCRTRVPVGRYVEGDLRASECKVG